MKNMKDKEKELGWVGPSVDEQTGKIKGEISEMNERIKNRDKGLTMTFSFPDIEFDKNQEALAIQLINSENLHTQVSRLREDLFQLFDEEFFMGDLLWFNTVYNKYTDDQKQAVQEFTKHIHSVLNEFLTIYPGGE